MVGHDIPLNEGGGMKNQHAEFPFQGTSITCWLIDHEEIEDELGILTPQEDVPHQAEAEDEEEDERVYHFR
jgi:hypothetical protein